MRAPRRFPAVLLFAVLCLTALALTGLLNWISSLLFLALELLAEYLRRRSRGHPPTARHTRHRTRHAELRRELSPRLIRRRRVPRGGRVVCTPDPAAERRHRLLVPLTQDRPALIEFALDECRGRHAELVVLFLRPFAVMPMGPAPLPAQEDDAAARALFARIARAAGEAGVPHRTVYRLTHDGPATILEVARMHEADIVVMEAGRRNRLWRAVLGDEVQAVQAHLPETISLLLHAA